MKKLRQLFVLICLVSLFMSGCGSSGGETSQASSDPDETASESSAQTDTSEETASRKTLTSCPMPEAPGTEVCEEETGAVDSSNSSEGYIAARYTGEADEAKVQIDDPSGNTYTYDLFDSDYAFFPLTGGDGAYTVTLLEHAYGDMYAMVLTTDLTVAIKNEFSPFLYPNQYVDYAENDTVTAFGRDLSDSSADDLDYLTKVYHYVVENVTYDTEKAAEVTAGYLPDNEETLKNGTGICFDYASLMSALLRSQGIPTRLEIGYSGEAYHAWISVYLEESGWIDNIISFDGKSWVLMDPTLAAANGAENIGDYVNDSSNYRELYCY